MFIIINNTNYLISLVSKYIILDNLELNLAWNFVNNTDRNVFLTGKAGTGKTTFLHKLIMNEFIFFETYYL